jgi:hypothetical protein
MAAGSGVKLVRVRRAAWGITSGKFGAGSSGSDQDNPDDRFRQQLEQRYGIRLGHGVVGSGRVSCMGATPGRGGFRSSDVCLK